MSMDKVISRNLIPESQVNRQAQIEEQQIPESQINKQAQIDEQQMHESQVSRQAQIEEVTADPWKSMIKCILR